MIKPKNWNGKDLKGEWNVTLKLDGVRMLRDQEGNPVSRSGKPLYNLEGIDDSITDAEIFKDDWETSVSMVRTKEGLLVNNSCAYSLDPLDPRLVMTTVMNPSSFIISMYLALVLEDGHEGLVLRQDDKWIKVKPKENFDVVVTGIIEGTGKHKGRMGALITDMGKVGTGFTDQQRYDFWHTPWGDELIEVECMGLTKGGKFRHPRFKRLRWDK